MKKTFLIGIGALFLFSGCCTKASTMTDCSNGKCSNSAKSCCIIDKRP